MSTDPDALRAHLAQVDALVDCAWDCQRELDVLFGVDGPGGDSGTGAAITPTALGRALRDARLAAGMTQRELAQAADMLRPNVARIERGRAGLPNLATLVRLCGALDISVVDLLQRAT